MLATKPGIGSIRGRSRRIKEVTPASTQAKRIPSITNVARVAGIECQFDLHTGAQTPAQLLVWQPGARACCPQP